MKPCYLARSLSLIFLLMPALLTGQAQEQKRPDQQKEQRKASEKKALKLLDDLIADARELNLPESRVLVQTRAADLLWSYDEKRARAVFSEAATLLSGLINNPKASDNQNRSGTDFVGQLRQIMLQTASAHDQQLALDFLRATRRPISQADAKRNQVDEETQLELGVLAQIAADDPKQALRVAERGLEHGFSSDLVRILSRLREKDPEGATKLTAEMLEKFRTEDLGSNEQARNVALNLLLEVSRSDRDLEGNQAHSADRKRPPILDERSTRDLLDLVVTTALNVDLDNPTSNPAKYQQVRNLLSQLRFLQREVDKYMPESSSALRAKMAEFNKTLDVDNRVNAEFYDLLQQDNIDAAIDYIAKAPEGQRDMFYNEAGGRLLERGEAERGRQVLGKISNLEWRNRVLEDVDRAALEQAASEGRVDQARQMLQKSVRTEDRAARLVQLAGVLAKRGDKKTALQFLDEARALISGKVESMALLELQIQVAQAYAALNPTFSGSMIDPLVDEFNRDLNAAAVLDRFDYRMFFKAGEFILVQRYTFMNGALARFLLALSSFARTDLERAQTSADRFERPEIRILARLNIAEGILARSPD